MKKMVLILFTLLVVVVIVYHAFPGKVAGLMMDLAVRNAGLTKKQIKIDNHTIVYLEGGKGPSIMLLHGYAADKSNWIFFAYYLNKKYHLIIPDIPGYGDSSQLISASYNLESQLERLHKFAEAVHLRKFHVVGNSMGGFYAGMYAARYPDEILSLGLFSAGGVKPLQFSNVFKLMEKGESPLLLKDENDFDRLMGLIFYKVPVFPYPIKYTFIQKALTDRSFNEKTIKEFAPDSFSLEPVLPRIKMPVLILWGDQDKILDVSSVPVFEKGLQHHKTVILQNCGHAPMVEKPEETAVEYAAFINGIPFKNNKP